MSPRRCSEWAVERDCRGRERLVRSRSTHGTREPSGCRIELSEAIASNQRMEVELSALQDRLSREQQRVWELSRNNEDVRRLHQQIQQLENERNQNLQRCDDLEDDLEAEGRKYDQLKEKYRNLKRASSQTNHQINNYQIRYEEKSLRLSEKTQEVELLRQRLRERDDLIVYNEDKIAQKDQSLREKRRFIDYLVAFLRNLGYSVVDERVTLR